MKSLLINVLIGIGFTIGGVWMTIESIQHREWFSALLALLLTGICVHAAWKDFKTLRASRSTA
jgi:hypothetical protein